MAQTPKIMQLLSDIIDLSVSSKEPLSVLLRKCLVLSAKLKNDRLKIWATKELGGYAPDDELPDYRILSVHSAGHFSGPFGAEIRNRPLPLAILREEHRKIVELAYLSEPIAAYEALLEKLNKKGE